MVSLTCSTQSTDGVTLVTARLAGGAVAQRVRVANRLDGPVWPPRRQGVPEAGWEDDAFEGVVPADETVALGYASPAAATEPPLEIVERTVIDGDVVADDAPGSPSQTADATPADAVRELGDPTPPRDAVPVPVNSSDSMPVEDPAIPTDSASNPSPSSERTPDPETLTSLSGPVATWLDEVEKRVALAEQLAAAHSVPAATTAVREAGSLDDAADVADAVQADAGTLRAVAERATALAERAEETDIPIETFRRLA